MSKLPYIINRAFVISGDGTVSLPGHTTRVLVDYSTYDGMVEDISVQLFTNQRAIDMIKIVLGEMYEDTGENPESASGHFRFEDGHEIQFHEHQTVAVDTSQTFAEIRDLLEMACDYAIVSSPFTDISIFGDLARKTWYSIECRTLIS